MSPAEKKCFVKKYFDFVVVVKVTAVLVPENTRLVEEETKGNRSWDRSNDPGNTHLQAIEIKSFQKG